MAKADLRHTRVEDIDDDVAVCRGGNHDWPREKIGMVPRGRRYIPLESGVFEIHEVCKGGHTYYSKELERRFAEHEAGQG
jgi:hypothetical protein